MIEITEAGYIIALISMGLAIMSALVRKAVLDQEKMRETKEKLKKYQEEMKKATKSGDTKKLQESQAEMMKLTMENLKHSFRPTLITFVPFVLVFTWLKDQYGSVGTVVSLFGFNLGWFWWYLLCAMTVSLIINKLLKVS
ncbi:MAG: hypothetical protein B6U86_05770 [Candidatus Altiarchaeales archaeon ex4484_43]|nr:MAG: hypothetical protein B6U86_05770 [Candidatus Altiarchaeales archaeon ex4484_43]